MSLDELRNDIIKNNKKGLPFIGASVVIWFMIAVVAMLNINIALKNILVFCCSTPMIFIAWIIGKILGVDIFSKSNPLGSLGLLFTMNQLLYLLIVIWVFNAVPNKMIMVYAMVFGAHLLPYSWLYKSKAYQGFSIIIPILSIAIGSFFNGFVVAATMVLIEIIFVFLLCAEMRKFDK